MASYQINWKPSAEKELRKLPKPMIKRVLVAVSELASDPNPTGSRKLVGSDHSFRVRVGDYRVIYDVQNSELIIEIIRVAHRKDVYR
jgi:mRNA interferase RelE/StbE